MMIWWARPGNEPVVRTGSGPGAAGPARGDLPGRLSGTTSAPAGCPGPVAGLLRGGAGGGDRRQRVQPDRRLSGGRGRPAAHQGRARPAGPGAGPGSQTPW